MLLGIVESFTATFYGPSWAPRWRSASCCSRWRSGPPACSDGRPRLRSWLFAPAAFAVAAGGVRARAPGRQRLRLLRRLRGAAIRRARHGLEHSRRLHGLCEFRLGGVLRARRLQHGRAAQAHAGRLRGPHRQLLVAARWALDPLVPLFEVVHATLFPLPLPVMIVIGGAISGLVGLGMGYLTLRLRGAFFAIATLALAVVLQTLIVNWSYVGGARGAYVIRPDERAADRQLRALPVRADAGARRDRDHDRPHDRALAPRLRLRQHPRRRARGRSLRRADAAAQAHRHHDVGRTDGHGGRAVSLSTSATCSRRRPSRSTMRSTRSRCR